MLSQYAHYRVHYIEHLLLAGIDPGQHTNALHAVLQKLG